MKKRTPQPLLPVSQIARARLALPDDQFDKDGCLIIQTRKDARELALHYGEIFGGDPPVAGDLFGAAHIYTAWKILLNAYAEGPHPFEGPILSKLAKKAGNNEVLAVLTDHIRSFSKRRIWHGKQMPEEGLGEKRGETGGSESTFRNWTLLRTTQTNPAFLPFTQLFRNPEDNPKKAFGLWSTVEEIDASMAKREPEGDTTIATLMKPIKVAPNSVKDQLAYILTHWGYLLGEWAAGLIGALDMIEEETRPRITGPGTHSGPTFDDLDSVARFSLDDDWMPLVVLLAKNVLVWLDQLSKTYHRPVTTLHDIPDEELNTMAARGFNALWLLGLWERSSASREIKHRMGNPEAAASAYSLFGYDIAEELGGWPALENLRHRTAERGIRLSSDMVPNHVGIDSHWVRHHPEHLLSVPECPYPGYTFSSNNLSGDDGIEIRLEDHYWNCSDAAVVFQRREKSSGETRFIYHGNDGTSMPWNDTAQIDFLKPEAREAVIQDILHVARNFPIIRFDAAMVLARKHIRRLWYPAPGSGGAIPSRSEHALSDDDFNRAIPVEFWREVVDRVAAEAPGTLLLAEAFWMMEGFFVRSLGMHRVYNSAFMNMLRDQKNEEYRAIIKKTLAFEPGILQRFVNFMNNPDEETAVEQFGNHDRYFAVCTLLATLPGLPMIGHGQIEGLSEKYGMEYVKAYRDEHPDADLIARHEQEIFPLLARRYLFAGAVSFRLYDFISHGTVNEAVFAYSNTAGTNKVLIIVNNANEKAVGTIREAAPVKTEDSPMANKDLAAVLVLASANNDDWLLLRDHNAGLWYLRSVGELRQVGLAVEIDGFGRQTYLDFRLETETADGTWRKLAAELAGRGVEDPDAAVADIRLRPVKEALEVLLPLGFPDAGLNRGKAPSWPVDADRTREALERLREFDAEPQDHPLKVVNTITQRLNASASLWRFTGRIFRGRLSRRFGIADFNEAAFMITWSILSLPCAGKWEAWGLESWLKGRNDAASGLELIQGLKTALELPGWHHAIRKPGRALRILFSRPEVRASCGVNSWEGVLWYNREGWNRFVRTTVLTLFAGSGKRQGLGRLCRRWRKADKKAGYRLERLLEAAR